MTILISVMNIFILGQNAANHHLSYRSVHGNIPSTPSIRMLWAIYSQISAVLNYATPIWLMWIHKLEHYTLVRAASTNICSFQLSYETVVLWAWVEHAFAGPLRLAV